MELKYAESLWKWLKNWELLYWNISENMLVDAQNTLWENHEYAPVIIEALNFYNESLKKLCEFQNITKPF